MGVLARCFPRGLYILIAKRSLADMIGLSHKIAVLSQCGLPIRKLPGRTVRDRVMTGQRRILLVDDDGELNASLRRLLMREGYEVDQAGSVAETLHFAAAGQPYDAIILDLLLPDGDGRDLCRQL